MKRAGRLLGEMLAINKGRIVEVGTHETLLAKTKGTYAPPVGHAGRAADCSEETAT